MKRQVIKFLPSSHTIMNLNLVLLLVSLLAINLGSNALKCYSCYGYCDDVFDNGYVIECPASQSASCMSWDKEDYSKFF